MGYDSFILLIGFLGFFLFCAFQAVLFRNIHKTKLSGLFRGALTLFFLVQAASIILAPFMIHRWTWSLWSVMAVVFLPAFAYGCYVIVYIYNWFVIVESSITLKILCEIARLSKTKPVSVQDLLSSYNTDFIVQRRLQRCVELGELEPQNHMYIRLRKRSFFEFRDAMARINECIFPSQASE